MPVLYVEETGHGWRAMGVGRRSGGRFREESGGRFREGGERVAVTLGEKNLGKPEIPKEG